jgi:amino acid transporter
MGSFNVLCLGFGSIVGWGWVILAGGWIVSAGTMGAVLACAIGAVLCILVAMTYAELTPALPLAGGELVFVYRGMGYTPAYITGWMLCLAYLGVCAFEGPSFATAINYVLPLPKVGYLWTVAGFEVYTPWLIVGVAMAVIITIVNYIGVKSATVFQTFATLALVLGGLVLLFGGTTQGSFENAAPMFTSFEGMASVLLVMPAMFVGFDAIPQAAEEMTVPLKKISKLIILSIVLAAIWYILMVLSSGLAAPLDVRTAGDIPVADAFTHAMGNPVFGKIIIVAALFGILTSWNGLFVGVTRVMFAMGRSKMLPAAFGKSHPKYKTPSAAILLCGIVTILAPFLGRSALVWFIDAAALGTVVAYFMVGLAFLQLRRKEPDLARPYRTPGGFLIGVLACLVGLFFLWLYTPLGPAPLTNEEWIIVLVWVVVGLIFYFWAKGQHKDVTLAEYEYLMFGNAYARKAIIGSRVFKDMDAN